MDGSSMAPNFPIIISCGKDGNLEHGCSTVTVVSTSTDLNTTHLCNFRVYFMNQVESIQVVKVNAA